MFDLKRQNVATTDPSNVLLQNQTGEVTSRGIELEAVANATKELKLIGAFTSYHLFTSKDLDQSARSARRRPTRREMLISGWADYTFKDGPLEGFGFGGGVRYVGSSWADTANTLEVPAVVLGDLAVHYEWQNWRTAHQRDQSDRQDLCRELRLGDRPASTATAAASPPASPTNGEANRRARRGEGFVKARTVRIWSVVHTWTSLISHHRSCCCSA